MKSDTDSQLVTPLQRRLFLRSIPGFSALSEDQLQLMADNMQPRFFSREEALFQPDKPVRAMYAVVEGRVRVERNDRVLRTAHPRDPGLGAMVLFAQTRWGFRAVAEEDTIALELEADDVFQIFETRTTILHFVITRIAEEVRHRRRQLGFDKVFPATLQPGLKIPEKRSLDIVHRVQLLRRMIALSTFRVSIAFELARHTPAVSLLPGTEIWRAGSNADHFYFLLKGCVACRAPGDTAEFVLGPRDSVGMLDVLAGGGYSFDATVREGCTALRVPESAFEQVMLDNPEFAMSVLALCAREALDLYDQLILETGVELRERDRNADDAVDEWMRAIEPHEFKS